MGRNAGVAASFAAGLWCLTQLANGAEVPREVTVPGGGKALATIARCDANAGYTEFLGKYCEALIRNLEPDPNASQTYYAARLREYFAAVAELAKIADPRGLRPSVSLSLATGTEQTARVLTLFGWRVIGTGSAKRIELGDAPPDAARHEIPAALGLDALLMQQTLERGETFRFEFPFSRVQMDVESIWTEYSAYAANFPGGLLEAFARDLRLAKTYYALSAASGGTADALIRGVGVRTLVERHADVLALCAKSFAIRGGAVVVPGGKAAEPVWARVAGANPRKPAEFFRALIEKDKGRLAAFYNSLAETDAAHQRYFTASQERLTRFYRWYRDSAEFKAGLAGPARTWRARVFRELPLDAQREWPAGDSLEAAIAIASLDGRRRAPLDERSAALFAQHFKTWRPLMTYFEALPGLGRAEFESLAGLEQAVQNYDRETVNLVLGHWYSLIDLIALGARAGSLDASASALAFRRATEACSGPHPSAAALEVLKSIGGGTDEGLRSGLLRLTGPQRAAFDRILALQAVPPLAGLFASNDERQVLAGLTGLVYAAHLEPDALLVVEDPLLVRKHEFIRTTIEFDPQRLFFPARLDVTSEPPGSRFAGGFANFETAAQALVRAGTPAAARRSQTGPVPPEEETEEVFRTQARLVEVYATVTDERGRHIDGLPAADFTVLDEGVPQQVAAFEPQLAAVSCALVLDGTSSMQSALASMRKTAFRLIDALRPSDSVAVFAFNERLSVLQPFTTDKLAAKRAVLGAQISGTTALYDALVRASRAISGRSGKKVIVVLTDGSDNNSVLTAEAAVRRAKNTGAAIYTIAEGPAPTDRRLIEQLTEVATATGGLPFTIMAPQQIPQAVETIAADFTHGYLFAFQPAAAATGEWRRIQVLLRGAQHYTVRAREGYYPE